MPLPHSKLTIVSIAVLAAATGSLLHEGLGHGVTAWLRGDMVTELTSNHLDSVRPDRLVDAGGTLVNLAVGLLLLPLVRRVRNANLAYFLWFLAALNLLHGAGYFLFSGVGGLGDWAQVIAGLPHQTLLRTVMAICGAVLYVLFVRMIAVAARPFCPRRAEYNRVGRLPYVAAGLFMTLAGAFDPLGVKLLMLSTVPAFFGGTSGLLWADQFMRGSAAGRMMTVERSPGLWLFAAVVGIAFVAVLGRGIAFHS